MSSELLSLLSHLSRLVSPEHRGPGDDLFCEGAVSDLTLQPLLRAASGFPVGSATATEELGRVELSCRIEDPDPVEVKASWAREPSSDGGSGAATARIEIRCSCARFAEAWSTEVSSNSAELEVADPEDEPSSSARLPCPHAWAMFLAAEQHGLLDEIVDLRAELALGPPLAEAPTPARGGFPVDDHEDLVRHRSVGHDAVGHGRVQGWRAVVDQVEALSRPADSSRGPMPARGWSFWAVLDPDSLRQRRGRLHLDLYKQALRRDGAPSPFLPTTLSDLEASSVSDDKQRGGMGLLRSALADQHRSERVVLDPRYGEDSVAFLLGALARSGCLRLPTAGDGEGPRRIRWQGGPSWALHLRLDLEGTGLAGADRAPADVARAADARLRGYFCREVLGENGAERQERPVHEASLVLRQGLLLWPGTRRRVARLAPVELASTEWAWIQTLRKHDAEIRVPHDEIETFLDAYWSRPDAPELELPRNLRPSCRVTAPTPTLALRLLSESAPADGSPSPTGALEVALSFDYSGREIDPTQALRSFVDPQRRVRIQRDFDLEADSAGRLDGLPGFPPRLGCSLSDRGMVVLPVEVLELPRLLATLALSLEERAPEQEWRIDFAGRPVEVARRLDARLDTRIDWFDLEATVHFDSGSCQLPELLDGLQRRGGFIDLEPATDSASRKPLGVVPQGWERALRTVLASGPRSPGASTLRFQVSQLLLVDSLLSDQLEARVERDTRATEIVRRLVAFDGVAPVKEPAGFEGKLRGYQREGVGWFQFLRDFRLGGCLADDMGLGKTVQVIAHLTSVHSPSAPRDPEDDAPDSAASPSLIVVPSSLVGNWLRELATFSPRLGVVDYTGPGRHRCFSELEEYDVVVTSYGVLRRDIVELASLRWATVVLDEAQAIKNRSSRTARAVSRLVAEQRLALTGTPVENHLGEAGSIFEFLNPGMLQSGDGSALSALADPGGATDEEIAEAARVLRPLILRRTKGEVLEDLPPKTEQTLFVELDERERSRYDELLHHYQGELNQRIAQQGMARSRMHVLEALLRLRQAACHQALIDKTLVGETSSKLEILLEHIDECVEGGHKVLVFSQFTSLLSLVEEQIRARSIGYELLHGRTRRRQERIDRFQNESDCSVFLISLKAGGVGLNLTAADYVFLLDPWWNPASEAQAIDRAHRYGQQRPVFAYRLITRNTVEERIEELKQKKRELAEALLAPASAKQGASLGSLTAEDVERLLL